MRFPVRQGAKTTGGTIMRMSRRHLATSMLAAIGGGATARAARAQQAVNAPAYLQQLYAQAKEAGQTQVIVYAASSSDNVPLYKEFQTQFPAITVKGIDLFGPPLEARLQAEFASSGPQADLLATGEPDLLNFKPHGWLQPFVPDTAIGIARTLIGPDDLWIGYATLPLGVIVNSNAVSGSALPKTWKDLASVAWRGKTTMSNPGGINGLSQGLAAALKAGVIDQAWLDLVAANKPLITPGAIAALQMVAGGQANMCPLIAYNQYVNAKKAGAPLGFVFPAEGYAALPAPFALVAKAPHTEAAKLLMAWFMTPAAQAMLSGIGQPGTMPGAPSLSNLPPGTTTTRFILDWRYLQDNYPALLQTFRKTFAT
jgi:iron(III) transport system substrate-binding protein